MGAGQLYADKYIAKYKHSFVSELSEEIAHDVILQLAMFKGEAKFSTWVAAIINNHWNDHIAETIARSEKFVRLPDLHYSENDGSLNDLDDIEKGHPDDLLKAREKLDNKILMSQLGRHIPERDRPLFEGIVKEGKTQLEMAQELGLESDAVESRFRRLRKRLSDNLKKS